MVKAEVHGMAEQQACFFDQNLCIASRRACLTPSERLWYTGISMLQSCQDMLHVRKHMTIHLCISDWTTSNTIRCILVASSKHFDTIQICALPQRSDARTATTNRAQIRKNAQAGLSQWPA